MSNLHLANSILHIKACENLEQTISKDLETPPGKSISQLFNEQKNGEKQNEIDEIDEIEQNT